MYVFLLGSFRTLLCPVYLPFFLHFKPYPAMSYTSLLYLSLSHSTFHSLISLFLLHPYSLISLFTFRLRRLDTCTQCILQICRAKTELTEQSQRSKRFSSIDTPFTVSNLPSPFYDYKHIEGARGGVQRFRRSVGRIKGFFGGGWGGFEESLILRLCMKAHLLVGLSTKLLTHVKLKIQL